MNNIVKLLAVFAASAGGLVSAVAQQQVSYSYDELGRLVRTEYGAGGADGVMDYALDPAGNRTTLNITSPNGEDPDAPTGTSCGAIITMDIYYQLPCSGN